VDERAIAVMRERGIEISGQWPRAISPQELKDFDKDCLRKWCRGAGLKGPAPVLLLRVPFVAHQAVHLGLDVFYRSTLAWTLIRVSKRR